MEGVLLGTDYHSLDSLTHLVLSLTSMAFGGQRIQIIFADAVTSPAISVRFQMLDIHVAGEWIVCHSPGFS